MRRNVAVIGDGDIAATITLLLSVRDTAEVTVVPTAGSLAEAPGPGVAVVTTSDAEELETVAARLARHAPAAVVVAAGEPAEVACAILLAETAFPRGRVLGAAAGAPGAVLRAAIAEAAGVWPGDVAADVLGGAGSRGVPVLSRAAIAGVRAARVLGEERLAALGATATEGPPGHQAVAGAVCDVVAAIAGDQHRVLTCAVACRGELGIEDRITAVPVRVGAGGMEAVVGPELSSREREALLHATIRMR